MAVISTREINRKAALFERLKSRLGVDGLSDGPVAILADVIGSEIESIENEIYDYFYRKNVTVAADQDLEEIASSDYNLTRMPATKASSDQFYFFVDTGTFGDLNSGSDLTIPKGTLISTSYPVENSNIIYELKSDVTLRSDLNETSFYAESLSTGSSQNIAALAISFHNFTNYNGEENDLLKVTNIVSVTNGSEEESDDSLRTRCVGLTTQQLERNKNYIFLSLLKENSIHNFEIIESYYGIGTVGIIVKGNGGGEVSDGMISRLEDLIATEAKHLGQNIYFSKGVKINFNISVECSPINSNLNETEKESLRNSIKTYIFNNIKEQEFRKRISFNLLSQNLKSTFNIQRLDNNNSIFSRIEKTIEDSEIGFPESMIVSEDETMIINRDEYISTSPIIEVIVR